ncbi:fimbrial-like protein [Scandinavium sp. H11S7]|uniref:Fimbrial-like protein n=1 Tax=Scandinavium hiltneri TaxID=2926519 RepID=A0ABT2E5K0_9ENTR|nr:fimbrial-like protein [Scandinavium hiltneri]MCS2158543.1 fimbrial-like protein [Scandinavium hiltneri]MCS2163158.1 fimbrial-like protein [Scandinavium hiltneri]
MYGYYFLLAPLLFSATLLASEDNVDVDIKANIITNTCSVSVENGARITLPVVKPEWFDNGWTATTDTGGRSFALLLKDCGAPSGASHNTLHLTFAPQSGADVTNQVFPNEILPANGGAQGVGIVIFSEQYRTNVLNTSGQGDVTYDITGKAKQDISNRYLFHARYQKTDVVVPGKLTSNIIIGAYYD